MLFVHALHILRALMPKSIWTIFLWVEIIMRLIFWEMAQIMVEENWIISDGAVLLTIHWVIFAK